MFQVCTYLNPDFIFLQAVCNLWEEEATWLHLAVDGVIPVLGLAVDPLTQVLLDLLKKIVLIKFSHFQYYWAAKAATGCQKVVSH